jgi:hypothetical protein
MAHRHHAPSTHPAGGRTSSSKSQNSHAVSGRPVRQHRHRQCIHPDNPVRPCLRPPAAALMGPAPGTSASAFADDRA